MSQTTPVLAGKEGYLEASSRELPNLNGIRALACLMVVIAHIPETFKVDTLGATGVALFFVLSGFLMGHLYVHQTWTLDAASRFAIARFARIAPIYWLVVIVCVLLTWLLDRPDFPLRIEGWNLVLRHMLFGGSSFVFWSISPEVQFYIFFLYLWWSVNASPHRNQRVLLLFLVCAAFLLTHPLWPGLSFPSKAHLFLAGCLGGLMPRIAIGATGVRSKLVGLQVGAIILIALPAYLHSTQPELYLASEVGLCMSLAIYILSFPSGLTKWLLGTQWMRRVGQASFAIYLTHMLVLYAGSLLLGLDLHHFDILWLPVGVMAVVLPMVLSVYIEIPLQRITRRYLNAQWNRRFAHSEELA